MLPIAGANIALPAQFPKQMEQIFAPLFHQGDELTNMFTGDFAPLLTL
jgi:hypothetical protein